MLSLIGATAGILRGYPEKRSRGGYVKKLLRNRTAPREKFKGKAKRNETGREKTGGRRRKQDPPSV